MKKTSILLSTLLALSFFSCSKEDELVNNQNPELPPNSSIINQQGENEGVTYQVRNLEIDPSILFLNKSNVTLGSSESELQEGILKLQPISGKLAEQLSIGKTLYINIDNYASAREITSVSNEGETYIVHTNEGALSDVFPQGSVGFCMDMDPQIISKTRGTVSKEHNFLNIDEEYSFEDNLKCGLKTTINLAFDVTLNFKKGQISPTEFSVICKATPDFDLYIKSAGNINGTYEENFRKFIPEQLMELLRSYEFEYNIPVIDDIEIPVKIKVAEVDIPIFIEANTSQETDFTFGLNGTLQSGFKYTANGWKRDITGVYENNLESTSPNTRDLNGELITDMRIIITPAISVTNDITATGEITLGVLTESNNYMSFSEKPVTGSRGTFITKANIDVYMPLIGKIPVNLANDSKELWNFGTIKKELLLSNLSANVTSKYSEIFRTVRQYETDFTVEYKYPVRGKKMTSEIVVTYETPTILGGWEKKTRTLEAKNITDNTFAFTVDVPFYWRVISILRGEWRTESRVRNITVKDKYGSEYTLSGEFAIKR